MQKLLAYNAQNIFTRSGTQPQTHFIVNNVQLTLILLWALLGKNPVSVQVELHIIPDWIGALAVIALQASSSCIPPGTVSHAEKTIIAQATMRKYRVSGKIANFLEPAQQLARLVHITSSLHMSQELNITNIVLTLEFLAHTDTILLLN